MYIREKLDIIRQNMKYDFCEISWNIFDTDYIRIYDKVNGKCIFTTTLNNTDTIPKKLLDSEIKKENLIKLDINNHSLKSSYAICFYLDAPEHVELGISAKVKYI